MKKLILLISLIIVFFSSCATNNTNINENYRSSDLSFFNSTSYGELDLVISDISNQLLLNIPVRKQRKNKFVITTFVNLNDFTKTSKLARVISETLINEMHTRKFKIIDYRTQEVISVDGNGEFLLTRNVEKLRNEIPESFLVVGTYSILNANQIILNSRIINNFTSEVISTAKVIYKYSDCKLFNICQEKKKEEKVYIPIKADK